MIKFSQILVDLDGVMADFHSAALLAHGVAEASRHRWPVMGQNLSERLDLEKNWEQGGKEQFWNPLLDIPNFWLNLEPFEWAPRLVRLCRNYSNEVVFCSSPARSFNGDDKKQKKEWLKKHGFGNHRVIFSDKKVEHSALGTLLIDDWEKQVDPFREGEGMAILFPQPWNRNHANYTSPVTHVAHILEYLTDHPRSL